MERTFQHLFGITMLLGCILLEVSCRPSNNESPTPLKIEMEPPDENKDQRSIHYQIDTTHNYNTKEIVDKIKAINDGITKPQRDQIKLNNQPQTGGEFVLDKETLEKIQQFIASGTLRPETKRHEDTNALNNDDNNIRNDYSRSRALPIVSNQFNPAISPASYMPYPYMTSMPVIVMPSGSGQFPVDNNLNPMPQSYMTRAEGSSSFPFQNPFQNPFQFWPFANIFPIIMKDPFLALSQGGGWNNIFEYGQSADVCSRRQKNAHASSTDESLTNRLDNVPNVIDTIQTYKSRQSRALKKRTISESAPKQTIEDAAKSKKVYATKPTRTTVKKPYTEANDDLKSDTIEGDLRFPFGSSFNWLGEKKAVAPSPGFFINRLRVRKGGVAIAGPGGVATAGRGGTAIVGPGGLAYTQPGGLAVAGPQARVVALSPNTDLNAFITRLIENSTNLPLSREPIREGKLVATGPAIYYHPNEPAEQTYEREWRDFDSEFGFESDTYLFDGMKFVKKLENEPRFVIKLSPDAYALSGMGGVALANPISHVKIGRGKTASVIHSPKATAVVGPGGIAHAEAHLASTQYLPFYGGAKGQYLEVKKDTKGVVVSEKIVAEESISSDNIIKNSDENLISRVLTANLQNLRTTSNNLLKLKNLGRKTGYLGATEKARFKSQLLSLGEAASNTIKLIDEIGDNIDMLFKSNASLRRYEDEEDVGEEGVGIDASTDNESGEILGSTLIAEAKPVGLAVIGENGLAASRPMATAVATTGVALARPIATAIAGIDPSLLGIDFQVNYSQKTGKRTRNN